MFLQGPLVQSWSTVHDFGGWLSFLKMLLGLALVELVFVAAYLAARGIPGLMGSADSTTTTSSVGFPAQPTVAVGIWLLFLIVLLVAGLLAVLGNTAGADAGGFKGWTAQSDVKNLLVTMLAAGIGSLITAMLGYVEHASEKTDFKLAFVPWYVARPVMGTLLGLIFYFIIRGGLFVTVNPSSTTKFDPKDLNVWTLAGMGSLVGMFSKNAISKLQEIFETLFAKKPGSNGGAIDEGGGGDNSGQAGNGGQQAGNGSQAGNGGQAGSGGQAAASGGQGSAKPGGQSGEGDKK